MIGGGSTGARRTNSSWRWFTESSTGSALPQWNINWIPSLCFHRLRGNRIINRPYLYWSSSRSYVTILNQRRTTIHPGSVKIIEMASVWRIENCGLQQAVHESSKSCQSILQNIPNTSIDWDSIGRQHTVGLISENCIPKLRSLSRKRCTNEYFRFSLLRIPIWEYTLSYLIPLKLLYNGTGQL